MLNCSQISVWGNSLSATQMTEKQKCARDQISTWQRTFFRTGAAHSLPTASWILKERIGRGQDVLVCSDTNPPSESMSGNHSAHTAGWWIKGGRGQGGVWCDRRRGCRNKWLSHIWETTNTHRMRAQFSTIINICKPLSKHMCAHTHMDTGAERSLLTWGSETVCAPE